MFGSVVGSEMHGASLFLFFLYRYTAIVLAIADPLSRLGLPQLRLICSGLLHHEQFYIWQ